MKKVLIKQKVIDIPYAPAIPGIPARAEYWVKNGEVSEVEPEDLEGWSHIPAYEGAPEIPEQEEVSHLEVIREFQSTDEDLEKMLAMEAPDAILEIVDITAEIASKEKEKKGKKDKKDNAKKFVKELDLNKVKTIADVKDVLVKIIDLLEE